MAVKIVGDAGLLAMRLFGIDPKNVVDISFHFPLKGAPSVTMTRLLTEQEYERAKLTLEHAPDLRTRNDIEWIQEPADETQPGQIVHAYGRKTS